MEVLLKRWVMRDGVRALVTEYDARGVPGATGTSCLICETESAMRRLWNYPADWQRLDDGKLLALFDQPFAAIAPADVKKSKTARPRDGGGGQNAAPLVVTAWR